MNDQFLGSVAPPLRRREGDVYKLPFRKEGVDHGCLSSPTRTSFREITQP
jgi:hypothetical protein